MFTGPVYLGKLTRMSLDQPRQAGPGGIQILENGVYWLCEELVGRNPSSGMQGSLFIPYCHVYYVSLGD